VKNMERRPRDKKSWVDPAVLYTRQEIAARTGLSDDVLSFWVKRRLLVHAEGGEGKGSHRRYAFAQVNIAALLAVFRDHFGANIRALSSLAARLQEAVNTFKNVTASPSDWWSAAYLATQLRDFRSGIPVMVDAHDVLSPAWDDLPREEKYAKRPATSETDIIASARVLSDHDTHALLKLAEILAKREKPHQDAWIAGAMLGIILNPPRYSDTAWLLAQTDDQWEILQAPDGTDFGDRLEDFGPAVFVPIGRVLRKVWGMPHPVDLNRMGIAQEGQNILDDLQIEGVVRAAPRNEERYYADVYVDPKHWEALTPRLKKEVVYFALRDPEELSGDGEGNAAEADA
jgi:DNA-binding transcriptional MerR regulator